MTAFSANDPYSRTSSDVFVWRCEDCHCTHIRAGATLLTFTAAEFATFVEAINKCNGKKKEPRISDSLSEELSDVMMDSLATN